MLPSDQAAFCFRNARVVSANPIRGVSQTYRCGGFIPSPIRLSFPAAITCAYDVPLGIGSR